ncbi:hypothetical protein ACFLW4_06865 [Chloroflexota bacterium]
MGKPIIMDNKVKIKMAITDGDKQGAFAWITVTKSNIYWDLQPDLYPQHFSYHKSGKRHHKYTKPIPNISDPSETSTPYLPLSSSTSLKEFKGFDLLFAGWIALNYVVLNNILTKSSSQQKNTIKMDINNSIKPFIGFDVCLVEPWQDQLVVLSRDLPWRESLVTYKQYLNEPDSIPSQSSSDVEKDRIIYETINKSCNPWLIIRFWDGLPTFLRSKFPSNNLKGMAIVMPDVSD